MIQCLQCETIYPDHYQNCIICKKVFTLKNVKKTSEFSKIEERYKFETVLGVGRQGIVYKVRNIRLKLQLALKILHRKNTTFRNNWRILQEARIISEFDHVNIVKIHDADLVMNKIDYPYYVMDFIAGNLLSDFISAGMGIKSAIRIGAQIASGLAYAHEKGIVHRDVCPQNIFITQDVSSRDIVKIIDFGIARYQSEHENGRSTTLGSQLFRGREHYTSPEAILRSKTSYLPSADEYSLGCVLYEMIVGKPPFLHDSIAELNNQHILNESPPLSEQISYEINNKLMFDSLNQLIQRMLNKQPECRFNDLREVERILLHCIGNIPQNIALCHSAEDRILLTELQKHMRSWSDSWSLEEISAGSDLICEIKRALSRSDVVVLLLSADFFNSIFFTDKLIWNMIIQKAKNHHTRLLPIIVRRMADLPAEINKIRHLPYNGLPVVQWKDRDEVWAEIVTHIRKICEKF